MLAIVVFTVATFALVLSVALNYGLVSVFNISARRVGGIRFLKVGRFCFSFCLTREYRPL